MPLTIGTQLGPYEVVSAVGSGGMGEVYRARDSRLGREVAVKVLPDVFAGRPDRLARFEREARAAGALSHPNILSVYDVGSHEGRPYLVLELLDGMTLRDRLREGDRLTVRKSLEIAAQVAHGLDAAHSRGIVHRDLKPENLFVTADGVVKILDFGLAKVEDQPEIPVDSEHTTESVAPWRTGADVVMGTAAYMSPEQIRGHEVDHRSDLFALGAVLYEMLAGAPAFHRESRPETLLAILSEDPPELAVSRPGIPPGAVALVHRCLEKDPADRFQSARDLAFALETLVSGTDSVPSGRAAGLRFRGRLRWSTASALLGLVLVAGLAGWLLHAPTAVGDLGTPRQITADPGKEAQPALSPDGSLVAYTSDRSGNDDIWIADEHGGESVQLTNDPAADRSPAWLPDGSAVLFESDRGGSDGIWKVPRLGGAAVLVVADARSPAVSPDGKWLAFARGHEEASRIAVVPLADPANVRLLTSDKDGFFGHNHPAWSPDGAWICYSDVSDLWVVAAFGGAARPLTREHATDDTPAWWPDRREIAFSSAREGTLALWSVSASGGTPRRLTLGTGPETEPSFSRDGRRMAYSTSTSALTGDVGIVNLRSRQAYRIANVRDEEGPALSPDQRTIVFSSNRQGVYDLWSQALDEGRPVGPVRRLTDSPGNKSRAAFSADGRWLGFTVLVAGQRQVWVMPAVGGPARRLTDSLAQEMSGAFSPDGSRLAFASDKGGPLSLWVMPIAGGAETGKAIPLTSGPDLDYSPCWSPDGRSIAFARLEGQTVGIWVVPADGSHPARRLAAAAEASTLRWNGAGLFTAARWDGRGLEVRRIDPRSGLAAPLAPPLALSWGVFDISRDGSLVAFDDRPVRGDIWVLDKSPFPRR